MKGLHVGRLNFLTVCDTFSAVDYGAGFVYFIICDLCLVFD